MAYENLRWTPDRIGFRLIEDATDHPLVTIAADTPDGTLFLMAEPELLGRCLVLKGVHVHAERIGVNGVGPGNLMRLAQVMMERMNVDELVVEGAVRTTGANRGYAPGRIRFARRSAHRVAR